MGRGRRVLVTRSGSGASNNLIRSLRAGDPSLAIIGCHHDAFVLTNSAADVSHLLPAPSSPVMVRALRALVDRERVDLIVPTTDEDVLLLSASRARFPRRLFLPRHATITICQDKYALTRVLRARGVPAPKTVSVSAVTRLPRIFRDLSAGPLLWCRVRRGSGSLGALPVKTAAQARNWILYWRQMRGVSIRDFTVAEYLPGRDYACQSLWRNGELVLIKTTQRVSYFQGTSGPSGVSSIGGLHKTIHEPRLAATAAAAVRAVDPRASGAFSIDLKEDARGRPCVTEINVGRFLTGTPIFDLTGKHNMAVTYVNLALGGEVDIGDAYDVALDSTYMIRDLDALPAIFKATEIPGHRAGRAGGYSTRSGRAATRRPRPGGRRHGLATTGDAEDSEQEPVHRAADIRDIARHVSA